MKREWDAEELVENFTLSPEELAWVGGRLDHNKLGLAVLLKFFQLEGHFPAHPGEVPPAVVTYLANQVSLPREAFDRYAWKGRTISRQRSAVRERLGFRVATVEDAQDLADWLAEHPVMHHDHQLDGLKAVAQRRLRELQVEPPTPVRLDRIVRAAISRFEGKLFETLYRKLPAHSILALEGLIFTGGEDDDDTVQRSELANLKIDPGPLGLKSVLREVAKLETLQAIHLPEDLFSNLTPRLVGKYRQRAAAEPPRELRNHPKAICYTLLAAFCWQRRQEVTDNLVELLIRLIHKINARAEHRVEAEFLADFKRVRGKTGLLYRLAEVALENPDGVIKDVLYPVVSPHTLRELVEEFRATGAGYHSRVHHVVRRSYTYHYRRMLPHILRALTFRSNNAAYHPVIDALEVLKRYLGSRRHYYPRDEAIPIEDVVRPNWQPLVIEQDERGLPRINRINYEVCVLRALRDGLRCREIWVKGADRYRDPDADLPADFEARRAAYYQALDQPLNVDAFIGALRAEMERQLDALDRELPHNPSVQLLSRGGGWIKLSPLKPQPMPPQLPYLRAEVGRLWAMTSLLDVLKETDLQVGFTGEFKSVASRVILDPATRQRRLLLCLYGLGTNVGLKGVSMGEHGEDYESLRYVRERFIQKESLQNAIARVTNATLAARQPHIWGEGSVACASDSRKFAARGENLKTAWHARYRGRGVMIYWHVERRSLAIFSQVQSPSSSEVAAMIQGVVRHLTDMQVDKNYVDSHGQSEVAFAFCHLLGFDLLPRLKRIHVQKLYRPRAGQPEAYPNLALILTRPINWTLIRRQYDQMIKYASALLFGTAEAES
ncbi:MAG: Tn3 family transposase, partial [Planctomycetota bacterium]